MAENKKSFILYADLIHTFEKLPDEIAGKLMKIILNYVNDKNPVVDDLLLQIAFEPIKLQLKRDLMKWDEFKKRQSENGKRGGRPAKKRKPKNPSLLNESQKSLNDTVNVTVIDNDIILNGEVKFPIKENFPNMPKIEDVGDLPELKINSAIELLKITKQTDATVNDITTLWKVFKIQNLTGKRYYSDVEAVHSHFLNWVPLKDIKKIKQENNVSTARKIEDEKAARILGIR